ncbi:ATP-grasp domain-containing protein [Aquibaculum arenosum]|uniref:ATP-grasp domain-containing protein n=1 Tax=Aquibaculum arenosum TaxID=3032591 RepID=A0ABT5YI57_9PROT|nr:ATP-grasp domain-containing protein [Fodinicurvata sp. CAU 1616]MDF2094480.1 ATP-grasp domain-containing protein [Fodinicurvata sp. CAU 1616]
MNSINISSSSLCVFSLANEAYRRGLEVTFLCEKKVQELCEKKQMKYNPKYNRVGFVFVISDGIINITFSKTKVLCSNIIKSDETWFGSLFGRKRYHSAGFYQGKKEQKRALSNLKIDTARYRVVDKARKSFPNDLNSIVDVLGFPLVAKPVAGSMGKGVHVNINTRETLLLSINEIKATQCIVEEYVQGVEYRVYTVNGVPVGAVRRTPPYVIGDGEKTINELLIQANNKKRRMKRPIINIEQAIINLTKRGLTLYSIPDKDIYINLGDVLGRSSGGYVIRDDSILSSTHLKQICRKIDKLYDGIILGIDLINDKDRYVVIEINDRPQLSTILDPDYGEACDISRLVIKKLFPSSRRVRKRKNSGDFIRFWNLIKASKNDLLWSPLNYQDRILHAANTRRKLFNYKKSILGAIGIKVI